MKFLTLKEWGLLLLLMLLALLLRFVYFQEHLNFSSDQAQQATEVLELYRQHKIPLIGNPITSIQYQGHYLFQGPAYYYVLFFFLFLGNFDPVISSALFTVFAVCMLIPLYIGLSLLLGKRSAILVAIIYAFSPYYVNYTRFHWNPNYQLTLLPLLFLLMGLYKKNKSKKLFFGLSLFLGILLHFHYQFGIVVIGIGIYYFFWQKEKFKNFWLFGSGILVGLSPLIVFELKNKFYNIQTLFLFFSHRNELQVAGGTTTPHYFLSLSLVVLIFVVGVVSFLLGKKRKGGGDLKKIYIPCVILLAMGLFSYSAYLNFQKPTESYWSYARDWNYLGEKKAYDVIKSEHLQKYNVVDLTYYDTRASVIKYLLKRDNAHINFDDYTTNAYIYIIFRDNNFMEHGPYEVVLMHPSKLMKTWQLNDHYNLYLVKRLTNT